MNLPSELTLNTMPTVPESPVLVTIKTVVLPEPTVKSCDVNDVCGKALPSDTIVGAGCADNGSRKFLIVSLGVALTTPGVLRVGGGPLTARFGCGWDGRRFIIFCFSYPALTAAFAAG